jgi:hypothetical protein
MLRRASLVCVLLTAACGGETRPAAPLECFSQEFQVEDPPFRDFETDPAPWFASGDATGATTTPPPEPCTATGVPVADAGAPVNPAEVFDAASTPAVETFARVPIEGGRCGSQHALVLTSRGHNDWGSLFGDYALVTAPPNGSGWDGIALWARTGRVSDRSVTLLLDTPQTTVEGGLCKEYCNNEMMQTFTDPNTGQVVTEGDVDPADACGNAFRRTLVTSAQWQLYLLPFESFVQDRQPNQAVGGMDTSAIMRITVRADKGANLELWLDDISFYRRR